MTNPPFGERPEDYEVIPWMGHVILDTDHRTPKRVSFKEWLQWSLEFFEHHEEEPDGLGKVGELYSRRVGLSFVDDAEISTVFFPHDMATMLMDYTAETAPPPLCFETMVFGGALDREVDRYYTWDEAEAGHAAMVERVKLAHIVVRQVEEAMNDG